jgi:DNA-binding MurR/RpiR family transcriptional regulator
MAEHGPGRPPAPLVSPAAAGGPEEAPGALDRLRACRPALAPASGRAAEYVLANPWGVRGLAITDLAAQAGVSVNTVNRLTRDLGYRGYREFAQALALDLGRVLGAAYSLPAALLAGAGPGDGPGDGTPSGTPSGTPGTSGATGVVARTLQLEQHCLQETARHLDAPAVGRAVDALAGAGAVLLVGTGSALPVCTLGAYRLTLLGIRAVACADPSAVIAELHLLRPGDVVFAVTHHGASYQVVAALRGARERGVAGLCLTAAAGSPAARAADVVLLTAGHEAGGAAGQFASRVAAAALVEALIAAVSWTKHGGDPAHAQAVLRAQQELNPPPAGPRPRARPEPRTTAWGD